MTQTSWEILNKRSENYQSVCNTALATGNPDLLQNALENIHFALELSMKAVIAKNGGNYPDYGRRGHDLEGLVVHKFGTPVTSILAMAKLFNATGLFNVSLSAWSMDCRYIQLENHADMRASINDYKELYKWISENLLK